MKNVPASISDAIKSDRVIKAIPRAIIDWDMNRYIGAVADNTPSDEVEGYDPELFPVDSIILPNRPTKGINKARINQSTIGDDYRPATGSPVNGRFYVADVGDPYKYWTSPVPSDGLGALTKCKPQVIYDESVEVNKIVITTENSWATAKTFSIQTTTSATPADGDWTEIANQSIGNSWKSSGQIVLRYDGSTWSTTNPVGETRVAIRGVRFVVTALEGGYKKSDVLTPSTYQKMNVGALNPTVYNTDGKNSFFDLIAISANFEADISEFIITVDDDFDMGEQSPLYPLGTVTTNIGTLNLSNLYFDGEDWVPGLFNANNVNSPYHRFIEPNAKVNVWYDYYKVQDGEDEEEFLGEVPELEMYTVSWTGQASDSVTVELSDFSKFFDTNDIKLPPSMWEDLTVPEIVWRILDTVGFVDYVIDYDANIVTEHKIPVFYTDGESTVWEVLGDLAKSAQAAIYFDAIGKLRVKTRDFAFSSVNTPVWDFKAVSTISRPADIIDAEINTEFEPNHYTVSYQTTNWTAWNNGQPSMQRVWEPDTDTVTLRGTPLVRQMSATDMFFYLGAKDAVIWPYKSKVNIEGEIVQYEGKQFVYYTGPTGAVANTVWVNTQDEYDTKNNLTPDAYKHKNHFTGAFKVTERGVWNSEPKIHYLDANGYSVRKIKNNTNQFTNTGGFVHDKLRSRVQLVSGTGFDNLLDMLLVTRGATVDTPFINYGTRMRFLKDASRPQQTGGLVVFNQGGLESGYYIELTPSTNISGANAATRGEVSIIRRNGSSNKLIAKTRAAIGVNIDYELDINVRVLSGGAHRIQVWLNGKQVLVASIQGSDRLTPNGKFGMYVRGKSRAEYEYLYALKREEEPDMPEDFSFLDKVARGYMGQQWDREWVYRVSDFRRWSRRQKKWVIAQKKFNRQFFDEFGPIAHEIREFDVKFDPKPVLHSRIYSTNDWAGCILEYRGNPFGAHFIIANTSRANAVLHGEDTASFSGTGDSINQVLTVFGRVLEQAEAKEIVAKNDDQIRIRGKIESEITSAWIQTEGAAKDLSDWLNAKFSYGNENITLEVFGNPLVEVTDIVSVNFPDKHLSGDWFVVAVKNNFDGGLTTTLDLRKRIS